jgi:hypothetical protein
VLAASAIFALTLAVDFGQPAPAAAADEARIEALVATERAHVEAKAQSAEEARLEAEELEHEHASEQFPPTSRARIEFDDLEKMKGRSVRVRTVSGRVRSGVVQEVGRDELHLRDRLRGGYAEYTLSRKQIVEIEAQ